MTFHERKVQFDREYKPIEVALLTFHGVPGFDVYNCSIPFFWEGSQYIYGRIERRSEWSRSWVRLFARTGQDDYTLVPDSMIYQLEDPFISVINKELILGGTHVRFSGGKVETVYSYFYRGKNLEDMLYFTTGPENMKDVRVVQLKDGVGVFSRPRSADVEKQYGSASVVGFVKLRDIGEMTAGRIASAPVIPDMFADGEWGGCNQCYLLDSGLIGIIGHKSYTHYSLQNGKQAVYTNVSFVYDPASNRIVDEKIIATRSSYPQGPAKIPELKDCAFTSGIVMRPDGRADLYSGLSDTIEGRTVIEYPFTGFGNIITVGE
ncbi:MAG TPA: DUF1861 family protein [Candidatus Limiplasma sp.]|nr:DUF1861 family protein [Candidatus Limiplasma sp.]